MVPWLLFVRMLAKVNMRDSVQVGIAFLCVILFFVISRPEIIPTAQDGTNGFDDAKHLRWRDIRFTKGYLEVCLRGIKQDPLCKRKTHVEGMAWRAIGNCSGTLSAVAWYQHHMSLSWKDGMDDSMPLFHNGKGGVLTQAIANRILHTQMFLQVAGVSAADAILYSLGGIRPLGRNALAGVAGDATAKVQGMWGSDAFDAYDRDMLERVLTAAQQMANFAGTASMPTTGVIDALRSAAVAATQAGAVPGGVPAHAPPVVPPDDSDFVRERRVTASGRMYYMYRVANGALFDSMRKARAFVGKGCASPVAQPPPIPLERGSSSAADAVAPPPPAPLVPGPNFMHEIVVEIDAPSSRKAPARRNV